MSKEKTNYCQVVEISECSMKDVCKFNQQLQQRIDKAKIEISALMSRYFYEEDFYIEDTDLDKILQILDKGEPNNENRS